MARLVRIVVLAASAVPKHERFSFVHLDVDLYQPTMDSLEFFYGKMSPGNIILCDDYGFVTCPGAKKAMDSFFADKPEEIVSLPTGQGFVVITHS
jgi:O-methyltransferase